MLLVRLDESLEQRLQQLKVVFDKKAKVFRDGAGNRLPQNTVMKLLDAGIDAGFESLDKLIDGLFNGEITLDKFAVSSADTLRDMSIYEATKAKGGRAGLDKKELNIVSSFLKNTFTNGTLINRTVNDDGTITKEKKTFGLNRFVRDLKNGDETRESAKQRIKFYGESTKVLDAEIKSANDEFTMALNILNKTKGTGINHAKICIAATSEGWLEIATLKAKYGYPPRHINCRCNLLFR